MSAILGWLIAWLFIKVLFINWKGGLKNSIESFKIETYLTPATTLKQFETVLPIVDEALDQFFKHTLGQKMPMISMFIGDNTVTQLKNVFLEELQKLFPKLVVQFFNHSKNDFAQNIETKWRAVLEPIFLKATRKFRIVALFIGLLWGIITLLLIHLL